MSHPLNAPPRVVRFAGSLCAVWLLAGCQTALLNSLSKFRPEFDHASAEERTKLETHLATDAWLADPKWTLLEDQPRKASSGVRAPDEPLRFRYQSTPFDEQLAKSGKSADKLLESIAARDDLIGWNAAILLAQRDPVAGRGLTKTLERLVSTPPQYDPRTGSPFVAPEKENERLSANTMHPEIRSQSPGTLSERLSRPPVKKTESRLIRPATNKPTAKDESVHHGPWDDFREWLPEWKRDKADDSRSNPMPSSTHAKSISPAMQAAAAEAWCRILQSSPKADDPAEALAPAGAILKSSAELPDEVRGSLFVAIARDVQPLWIPTLPDTFDEFGESGSDEAQTRDDPKATTSVELRRAAIGACLVHARRIAGDTGIAAEYNELLWPVTVTSCRRDPDSLVRRLYGRWAAWAGHPDAQAALVRQLDDADTHVRDDALVSLGVCGTDRAHAVLVDRAKHPGPLVRAAAIRGLSYWGPRELGPYRSDESHHVRRVVADELARHPEVGSAILLKELVLDSNATVQRASIAAVSAWPDELAIPVLLTGLTDGFLPIRKDCWQDLEQRTHVDDQFDYDDPDRDDRSRAVLALARRHNWSLNLVDLAQTDGLAARSTPDSAEARRIAELVRKIARSPAESAVTREALAELRKTDAAHVRLIEQAVAREAPGPSTGLILRDVLPSLSPLHAALADLSSPEVINRRQAAQRLRRLGGESSLGSLAIQRLHERLPAESDLAVWRDAVWAIMPDASSSAASIAQLAVNHAEPEIRALGCQYFAQHGSPEHAEWLRPLLADPDREVRIAAIAAIGRCGNADVMEEGYVGGSARPLPGLRSLLTHADARLRDAALSSLAELGDEAAMAELVRRAGSPDWRDRAWAVERMGATGRAELAGALLDIASREGDPRVRHALAISLPQVTPADRHPPGLANNAADDAKLRAWLEHRNERGLIERAPPRQDDFRAAGHSPIPAGGERL